MNDRQLFICKIQLSRPAMLTEGATPKEDELAGQHFDYLQNLVNQGIALLVGRTLTTDPDTYGLILLKATSVVEAWQIMENDPGVKNGVWLADLRPFRVALSGNLDQLA